MHGPKAMEWMLEALWLNDYNLLFDYEFERNKRDVGGGGYQMQPSKYRARLNGERAQDYDARVQRHERDSMAIALHSNNQQRWSPSLLARSVAYFGTISKDVQCMESRQRRVASQPTTMKALRIMRNCRCVRTGCVAMLTNMLQMLLTSCFAFIFSVAGRNHFGRSAKTSASLWLTRRTNG